jgi:UDP-N-acetylmuramate--alanine ligase
MVPIYPAREEPIEGITSELIGGMLSVDWRMAEREELAALLATMETDVVVTFGAGNIDVVCEAVARELSAKS